jgi:ubiquinone biosynthesis protein
VLTLEWIDGIRCRIAGAGGGRPRPQGARRAVIQSFLRHALRDGFFHADMHPGNLFVDRTGHLVAVDFGIMGRLGRRSGASSPRSSTASSRATTGASPRCISRPATCRAPRVDDFAQAIRAIGEPIHGRRPTRSRWRAADAAVRGHRPVRHATRPELVLLQKTMVVVEGVARTLDPAFDMWKTAEPVVREWIERNLGPRRDARLPAVGGQRSGDRSRRGAAGALGPCRAVGDRGQPRRTGDPVRS